MHICLNLAWFICLLLSQAALAVENAVDALQDAEKALAALSRAEDNARQNIKRLDASSSVNNSAANATTADDRQGDASSETSRQLEAQMHAAEALERLAAIAAPLASDGKMIAPASNTTNESTHVAVADQQEQLRQHQEQPTNKVKGGKEDDGDDEVLGAPKSLTTRTTPRRRERAT